METNWVIWQLVDSGFPSGGFAHSGGLEATMQWHEVDRDRLADFIQSSLIQVGTVLFRSLLPYTARRSRSVVSTSFVTLF